MSPRCQPSTHIIFDLLPTFLLDILQLGHLWKPYKTVALGHANEVEVPETEDVRCFVFRVRSDPRHERNDALDAPVSPEKTPELNDRLTLSYRSRSFSTRAWTSRFRSLAAGSGRSGRLSVVSSFESSTPVQASSTSIDEGSPMSSAVKYGLDKSGTFRTAKNAALKASTSSLKAKSRTTYEHIHLPFPILQAQHRRLRLFRRETRLLSHPSRPWLSFRHDAQRPLGPGAGPTARRHLHLADRDLLLQRPCTTRLPGSPRSMHGWRSCGGIESVSVEEVAVQGMERERLEGWQCTQNLRGNGQSEHPKRRIGGHTL